MAEILTLKSFWRENMHLFRQYVVTITVTMETETEIPLKSEYNFGQY